jgi:FkbM family methyltransferase
MHHPIFSKFTPFSGVVEAGEECDYVGSRWLSKWGHYGRPERVTVTFQPPSFHNEYFEWVDLLTAASEAGERFVMMELGAGYGRWGIPGALAAKQLGKAAHVRFVEGEPQHAAWLREAVEINGLAADSVVYEAALSYAGKPVPFLVGTPDPSLNARTWFGQTIGEFDGCRSIPVAPITFEQAAEDLDRIDYVDADMQGAELDLVRNSLDTLTAKVRRIHIGTHGAAIEDEIRDRFTKAGWQSVWDFRGHRTEETPYGPIAFEDGVQGWLNPRLA